MEKLYIQLGFIQGDGCLGRLDSDEHLGLEINIGHKDLEIFDLFDIKKVSGKRSYYEKGFNEICSSLGFSSKPLPERPLPSTISKWRKDEKIYFLKGLYSANGSFIKVGRIAFKTTCEELSEQLKLMLESFGFNPYVTTNKPKNVEFSNGTYKCKESYDVNLGRQDEILRFYNEIGFLQKYKMDNIREYLISKNKLQNKLN